VKLTIYEKNIDKQLVRDKKYRASRRNYNSSYIHSGVTNRMKNNEFNKQEMVAAVASHEFGHFDHPLGATLNNPDDNLREEIADFYQHKAISSILEHRIYKLESKGLENIKVNSTELK
jgi:hypothetical protein